MNDTAVKSLNIKQPGRLPIGPILAVLAASALTAWMSLGPAPQVEAEPASTATEAAQSVRVLQSHAEMVSRVISSRGETRAFRSAAITARTSGFVDQILVRKGQNIKAGDTVATLNIPDFSARSAEAASRFEEALRNLDKVVSLQEKGLSTKDELGSARTSLAAARADWAIINEEREDMTIKAPFDGRLNDLDIEIGDAISSGTKVASILDLDQLVVSISVPQTQIDQVSLGQKAEVKAVSGASTEGEVTFISAEANNATRSFPVEVTIDNKNQGLLSGLSASVYMSGPKIKAHSIPTAYLSLAEDGSLVIKTAVDGQVKSYPVEIVSSGLDTITVSGLPDTASIITVGQGFVRDGDKIEVAQ
jgi:multidrug efflux system membrane fusion protein